MVASVSSIKNSTKQVNLLASILVVHSHETLMLLQKCLLYCIFTERPISNTLQHLNAVVSLSTLCGMNMWPKYLNHNIDWFGMCLCVCLRVHTLPVLSYRYTKSLLTVRSFCTSLALFKHTYTSLLIFTSNICPNSCIPDLSVQLCE